ncbi:hypothetical protein OQA88_11494 [Cercophora sp. LCS_1]
MPPTSEPDTIRILVATDNHVGYEEKDAIRKDDSWRTFDEIMTLARTEEVDMVLLGGDLFHENRPSRKAMYQVMRSLRRNCLGMKPCELEFMSDANEVFEGAFNHVNYEDPDINISIPVFSIHGNHDDPSGDGHYCSLDLLQVAGLVNYFGRVPEADNIHVKPVLLQKGRTKLALYGLSNVRDERMFRTFRDNKVRFYRPGQQQSDFFNLLTVHQNHHAHTATSYLPENMLPDFLDLIVWGHEHECLIDPQKNPETGFHVMQPGSSVATSLCPGEAAPKHVAILSITGRQFQIDKIPLKTVRPFVMREVVLSTDKRFKGLEKKPDNRHDIVKRLMVIVEEMIEEAKDEWKTLHQVEDEEPPLPLIRLKVEYTAPEGGEYEVENPQRFSNRFIGKVKDEKGSVLANLEEALDGADAIKVETLVDEFFAQQDLRILPRAPFGDAVDMFATKDDKGAIEAFVAESLTTQVKELLKLSDDKVEEGLDAHMEEYRRVMEKKFVSGQEKQRRKMRYKEKPEEWDSDLDGHWTAQPGVLVEAPPSPEPTRSNRRQPTSGVAFSDDDDEMFVDTPDPAPAPAKKTAPKRAVPAKKAPAPKKAAPAKKAPARGRKKANPFIDSEAEEEDDVIMEDDDEPVAVPPPKTRASRATTSRAAPKAVRQTTLNFSQSQPRQSQAKPSQRSQKAIEISDDEISDDAFESMPATRSRRK